MKSEIKKVLLLHSFNDSGYERRINQIQNNPKLDSISFEHICIFDKSRGSSLFIKLEEAAEIYGLWSETDLLTSKLIKEEVEPLILTIVEKFEPQIFIIHVGSTMVIHSDSLLETLSNVKKKFPNLSLALQEDYILRIQSYRSRHDIKQLESNQIEWILLNFIDDPEINYLINEIF